MMMMMINVQSKIDLYNSVYYNVPNSQINRLKQIQNYLFVLLINAPNYLIPPVLRCLQWLKIHENI